MRKLNLNFLLIVFITVLSIGLIFPTSKYFYKVFTEKDTPTDPVSEMKTNYTKYFDGEMPKDIFDWKQWEKNIDETLAAQSKNEDIKTYTDKLKVRPEAIEDFKKQLASLTKWNEYNSLQNKSLKLGLDLMGGVDVLLAIDMEKTEASKLDDEAGNLKKRFAKENIDASFELDKANKSITVSVQDKKDYRNSKNLLSEEYYKQVFKEFNADDIENGKVVLTLQDERLERFANDTIEGALKVIRNRVDELKVTQPSVAKQGKNRVRVQLPGEKDPEKVITNIIKPATLEFRIVHDESEAKVAEKYNLDGTLKPGASPEPGYVFRKGIRSNHSTTTGEVTEEKVGYLVKDNVELDGKTLKSAWVDVNNADLENPVQVHLEFNSKGAGIFKEVTTRNTNKRMSIILDNIVYSAPVIREPIPNGRCSISGNFVVAEANDLSLVLKAGALPADLEVIEKRSVGATLGADAIRNSVWALGIGAAVVTIFMVLYYGIAGLVANIAVILNVLIIIAVMAMTKATLTLSGIGGILLTIGMAVDANVLIYERIREELDQNKPMKQAIALGFKRVFGVIFDANLTTLLTAMILLQFAEGSIQGFALTMSIGIIANLYTGLYATHTMTDIFFRKFGTFGTGKIRIFKNCQYKVMETRKVFLVISIIMIVISLGAIAYRSSNFMALDFKGGVITNVKFNSKVTTADIRKVFDDAKVGETKIQQVIGKEEFLVKLKLVDNDIEKTQNKVEEVLGAKWKLGALAQGAEVELIGTQAVGNEVGQEFIVIALQTVILAVIAMLLYLTFRFEFIFGAGAAIALVHDVIITLGLIALTGREISLDVVSALLILIGYSVNDTIVVFDRIRENLRNVFGQSFFTIANRSINETFSRTTITSITVLFCVIVLYFFSSGSLNDFAFTLIVGVIVGTYSSIFIATPVVNGWNARKAQKLEEDQTYKKKGYAAAAQKMN